MIAVHNYQSKVGLVISIFFWLFLPSIPAQNVQLEVLNSTQGLSQGMIYDILQETAMG